MAGAKPRCPGNGCAVGRPSNETDPPQADQRIETQQAGQPLPPVRVLKNHVKMVTATRRWAEINVLMSRSGPNGGKKIGQQGSHGLPRLKPPFDPGETMGTERPSSSRPLVTGFWDIEISKNRAHSW